MFSWLLKEGIICCKHFSLLQENVKKKINITNNITTRDIFPFNYFSIIAASWERMVPPKCLFNMNRAKRKGETWIMEHCPVHWAQLYMFQISRDKHGVTAAEERAPEEIGQPKPRRENEGVGFFAAFRENQHMSKMYKCQSLTHFTQLPKNHRYLQEQYIAFWASKQPVSRGVRGAADGTRPQCVPNALKSQNT